MALVKTNSSTSCDPTSRDVIVVYEGLSAAQQALETVADLADDGAIRHVRPSTWQFSTLKHPLARARSLEDAAQARWLVIASHRNRPLPTEVIGWVRDCVARNRNGELEIVALGETPAAQLKEIRRGAVADVN
jgi:hypothetical protein